MLLKEMEEGRLSPGMYLPSEQELAAWFKVSKATVRQALNELVIEGRIRREQGRGTYVLPAGRKLEKGPRELESFTCEMNRHGLRASSVVLTKRTIHADSDTADRLQLPPGTPVYEIRRLRLANDEPMGIQSAFVPVSLAPDLLESELVNGSLYETLELRYGIIPAFAHEVHFATILDYEEAKLLKVPGNSPGLAAERVTFLSDRRPMEFVRSVMRGDRYKIVLELVSTASEDR